MRQEARDTLALVGKSALFVVGGILVLAAAVEISVGGASWRAFLALLAGLAMVLPPLALAFRDAACEARKGRL